MVVIKNIKWFLIFVIIGLVALIFLFSQHHKNKIHLTPTKNLVAKHINRQVHKVDFHFQCERIVHIDLKGAPPKVSYYRKLFPLLSQLGATGLLLEYEDMFPYSGRLINVSAYNAYSIEDVAIVNKLAKENNLKIIPLIQIFSHMEFLLKLHEFKEFREIPSYPQVICPTHKNTAFLLVSMIQQVVRAHPDIDMIHIGSDSVNYLGQCNRCSQYVQNVGDSKNTLFLNHIKNVTSVIKIMFPKLRILMWDNQLRSMQIEEVLNSEINDQIEIVVWKYTNDVYEDLGPSLWEGYGRTFKNVWISSAFKAAGGKIKRWLTCSFISFNSDQSKKCPR